MVKNRDVLIPDIGLMTETTHTGPAGSADIVELRWKGAPTAAIHSQMVLDWRLIGVTAIVLSFLVFFVVV